MASDAAVSKAAAQLMQRGWLCLPLPRSAAELHKALRAVVASAPEALPGAKQLCFDRGGKLALPSAQHAPAVRQLRQLAADVVTPVLRRLLSAQPALLPGVERGKIGIASCPDALMLRKRGSKITPDADSWHRDCAQGTTDASILWGGWVNADVEAQYFTTVEGSHLDSRGALVRCQDSGFLRAPAPSAADAKTVEVPPGHILVFFERILHTVRNVVWSKRKTKDDMVRLFTGFWAAPMGTASPLCSKTLECALDSQGLLPIKGGQQLCLVARHRFVRSEQNRRRSTAWAEENLQPRVAAVVKAWADQERLPQPQCPSLQKLGALFPPYTPAERALFRLRAPCEEAESKGKVKPCREASHGSLDAQHRGAKRLRSA